MTEYLTFLGGVAVAIISAIGFYLADRRKIAFQQEELKTKIALDRADDQASLEQAKIQAVEKAVERAELRVERVADREIERERRERLAMQESMAKLREEMAATRRELQVIKAMRCPYPQCPVFRAEFRDG